MRAAASAMGVHLSIEQMPVRDLSTPTGPGMRAILDRIDQCLREQKPVYVHCWGGIGRTGTVVGCFLARHGYASGDEVLERIRSLRSRNSDRHYESPENEVQRNMVVNWPKGA
jgi:protein-tyrosine phosphatase